jgi:hypothetical protein
MEPQHGASGVATTAKDEAGQVGQTAAQAGGQVAQTGKEQAQNVVGEAKQQARDLVGEARMQVRDQAGTQKGRAVDGLRTLADELDQMALQGGQSGIANEVARQAAQRAHGLADHLDRHEPSELLEQVRAYARRRPVAFLAGAAVLGVLAGRMTRSLASSGDGSGPRQLTGATTAQLPAARTYPATAYPAEYAEGSAAYPAGAGYGEPGYPVGGAEATGTAGYEAGYDPGYESGYGSGGFRPSGEPGYSAPEPGYPTPEPGYAAPDTGYPAPEPGYPTGGEPGRRPPREYEGGGEDPTWSPR